MSGLADVRSDKPGEVGVYRVLTDHPVRRVSRSIRSAEVVAEIDELRNEMLRAQQPEPEQAPEITEVAIEPLPAGRVKAAPGQMSFF